MRDVFNGKTVEDEVVWKYFKLERFISMLSSNMMYFASASQFIDPFEGAVAVQTVEGEVDQRYFDMESTERAFFELKRLTKICCWHRANYESDAMWKLYAGDRKGIAICSTPDRMRTAFKPFRLKPEYGAEDLWGGPVEYIDLTQVRMTNAAMLRRFFFKHRAFEWEREFRLAISLRGAEDYGVAIPTDGIFIEVDLSKLINRIILGSTITKEEMEIVADHATRANLADRLELSTLLGKPRYI